MVGGGRACLNGRQVGAICYSKSVAIDGFYDGDGAHTGSCASCMKTQAYGPTGQAAINQSVKTGTTGHQAYWGSFVDLRRVGDRVPFVCKTRYRIGNWERPPQPWTNEQQLEEQTLKTLRRRTLQQTECVSSPRFQLTTIEPRRYPFAGQRHH